MTHNSPINKISKEDFDYAGLLDRRIKLIGFCTEDNGKKYAMVAPFLLEENHPLYAINGVFNGILVHGNMVDDVVFVGRGAGKLPTASAVVSDIIEEAMNIGKASDIEWADEKLTLNDKNELKFRYMVRMRGNSADGKYKAVFPDAEELNAEIIAGEYAIVTKEMTEGEFLAKYAELGGAIKFIRLK